MVTTSGGGCSGWSPLITKQRCAVPVLGWPLVSPSLKGSRDTRSFLASSHSFLSRTVPLQSLVLFPCNPWYRLNLPLLIPNPPPLLPAFKSLAKAPGLPAARLDGDRVRGWQGSLHFVESFKAPSFPRGALAPQFLHFAEK